MVKYIGPECALISTRGTASDLIAIMYDDASQAPEVTVENNLSDQQLIRADGIPVAIIANGAPVDARDVFLLQRSAAKRLYR